MPKCVHCHVSVVDAGPADVGRLWRDPDHRVYCYAAENGYHEADPVVAAGVIYPMPEYDRPEGPPAATHWFWQVGNSWAAVVGDHERATWWSGDDPAELGGPTPWELPIGQRPPSGTLHYRDEDGAEHSEPAVAVISVKTHACPTYPVAWFDLSTGNCTCGGRHREFTSKPPRKPVTAYEVEAMEENGDEFYVLTFHHGLGEMTRVDLGADDLRDLAALLTAELASR